MFTQNSSLTQKSVFAVMLLLVFGFSGQLSAQQQDPNKHKDLFEMSIEELMNVEITSTATLTKTKPRLVPATVTTITQEEIRNSGARSLYELLDIYVPNFQMIFHTAKLRHMGLRGINSNRDDKYLLLVNGRVMNEKTDFGVMTERDLPMLSDIHHIDVVRGPGSALYGPGALAMVISIVTDTARTFQGTEVTTKLGAVEEFYSTEFKYGKQDASGQGIFLYAGGTEYPGASLSDSPIIPGGPITINGQTYAAGDEIKHWFKRLNESFDGLPKWKLHGQYTNGGLDLWARYTSGGEYIDHMGYSGSGGSKKWWLREGEGYQQGTVYLGYTQDVSKTLSIKYAFSYDSMNVETLDNVWRPKSFQENEYYGRIMANWKPAQRHSLAFGAEWSHEQFGRENIDSVGKAVQYTMTGNGKSFADSPPMPRWSTDMKSLVGEYQWNINEQLTTFLGGRLDDHTFTDTMWSPRAVIVFTPSRKDTFKLIGSQSVRTNTASEMKMTHDNLGERSKPEVLDAYELRYERQQTDALRLAGGLFYHSHDVIGWSTGVGTQPLGNMKSYGIEFETSYRTKKTRVDFSHAFTKMVEFDLAAGVTSVELTSAPMGYGNDLADWHNHISKLVVHRELTDKLNLDGSLYVYWGSPGAKDYAEYRHAVNPTTYQPGFDEPFRPSVFLNLGLEYQANDRFTLRVDGYNLLGLFDQELNKRQVGFNTFAPGAYRVLAPAVGVSLTYRF